MFDNLKKLNLLQEDFAELEAKYLVLVDDKQNDKVKKLAAIEKYSDKIIHLENTKNTLEQDIKNLAEEKRREDENIKHATKIILEKNEIEFEKKIALIEKAKDTAIAAVKDEYRDKREEQLDTRGSEMKAMYTEVLAALTNVKGTLDTPAVPVKSE